MTDENKIELTEVKTEKTCLCQSKGFRNFLVIALGSFVGVFSALSLFAALHKPPMIKPVPFGGAMIRPCHCKMHHFDGYRGPRGDFHRKMEKRDFQKFEKRDFQRPDRADFAKKPPVKE